MRRKRKLIFMENILHPTNRSLRHPFTALSVANLFVKEVVCLHGFPSSNVSDWDHIFMSIFWRELFHLHDTTLKRSTAYHPQIDGHSEIVDWALETCVALWVSTRGSGLSGCRGKNFHIILLISLPKWPYSRSFMIEILPLWYGLTRELG